jgi:Zn-dependent peptidase ImmA (M78 family)
MTLRRGFKTAAEAIAVELRDELGLTAHERLDCEALASHLAIEVAPLTDLVDFGATLSDLERLMEPGMRFSAITVYRGTRCKIFYNHTHPRTRRANSLAHELSHIILEHEPERAVTDKGVRNWNEAQETEADWQAGALLVPRDGALRWLAGGGDVPGGAAHFAVSEELFRWRANHTGVVAQLRRRAA